MCCHTTLWNTNVRKQAINDKLQGSVATYLRFGGIFSYQIKKGLYLQMKKNWKSMKVTYKNVIVSCTFFVF